MCGPFCISVAARWRWVGRGDRRIEEGGCGTSGTPNVLLCFFTEGNQYPFVNFRFLEMALGKMKIVIDGGRGQDSDGWCRNPTL